MTDTMFDPPLHTQVRRQEIFEGLVGKDLTPEQTEAQMGPYMHSIDIQREQLTSPQRARDERLHMRKPVQARMVPSYNTLYGSLRSPDSWKNVIDNFARGTITTVANATTLVNVTLANPPHFLLSRWPGANQFYLCIRQFSMAPQTATFATSGALDIAYNDLIGGQIIPLADIVNNQSVSITDVAFLIPTPITDPDSNAPVGQLSVALNTGATPGTYNWQISFSAVYLIPELHGYDIVQSNPFVEMENNGSPAMVRHS
jgi:hypothetical protein